ncbi:unnamed protein product [Prorocentrum cordatum]|uniref:J domain-containing protein n=1 Tax=Prorocentrum cordatum TaxID=2364126 RepID=A0ABN9RDY7_9DINO|nr:unnamed protein product [Polarella glacialis]
MGEGASKPEPEPEEDETDARARFREAYADEPEALEGLERIVADLRGRRAGERAVSREARRLEALARAAESIGAETIDKFFADLEGQAADAAVLRARASGGVARGMPCPLPLRAAADDGGGGPPDPPPLPAPPPSIEEPLPEFYQLLRVPLEATFEQIKKGYRKQAMAWHPDKNRHRLEDATERFKRINEAFDTLYDPRKREAYDSGKVKTKGKVRKLQGCGWANFADEDDETLTPLGYKYKRTSWRGYVLMYGRIDDDPDKLPVQDENSPRAPQEKIKIFWRFMGEMAHEAREKLDNDRWLPDFIASVWKDTPSRWPSAPELQAMNDASQQEWKERRMVYTRRKQKLLISIELHEDYLAIPDRERKELDRLKQKAPGLMARVDGRVMSEELDRLKQKRAGWMARVSGVMSEELDRLQQKRAERMARVGRHDEWRRHAAEQLRGHGQQPHGAEQRSEGGQPRAGSDAMSPARGRTAGREQREKGVQQPRPRSSAAEPGSATGQSFNPLAMALSTAPACNCGGFHLACRMRDMDLPAEDFLAKVGKDMDRLTTVSTAASSDHGSDHESDHESDHAVRHAVPNGGRSESVLGGGACACGGFHRACRLRDSALAEQAQLPAAPEGLPAAALSLPRAEGPLSEAVVGGAACRCGGYHRSCRPVASGGRARDLPAPGPLAPAKGAVDSATVVGPATCRCGGYHRACRLGGQGFPAARVPQQPAPAATAAGGARCSPSDAALGSRLCLCGGYHRACQSRAQGSPSAAAAPLEGARSSAASGLSRARAASGRALAGSGAAPGACQCGGYHRGCR